MDVSEATFEQDVIERSRTVPVLGLSTILADCRLALSESVTLGPFAMATAGPSSVKLVA